MTRKEPDKDLLKKLKKMLLKKKVNEAISFIEEILNEKKTKSDVSRIFPSDVVLGDNVFFRDVQDYLKVHTIHRFDDQNGIEFIATDRYGETQWEQIDMNNLIAIKKQVQDKNTSKSESRAI